MRLGLVVEPFAALTGWVTRRSAIPCASRAAILTDSAPPRHARGRSARPAGESAADPPAARARNRKDRLSWPLHRLASHSAATTHAAAAREVLGAAGLLPESGGGKVSDTLPIGAPASTGVVTKPHRRRSQGPGASSDHSWQRANRASDYTYEVRRTGGRQPSAVGITPHQVREGIRSMPSYLHTGPIDKSPAVGLCPTCGHALEIWSRTWVGPRDATGSEATRVCPDCLESSVFGNW